MYYFIFILFFVLFEGFWGVFFIAFELSEHIYFVASYVVYDMSNTIKKINLCIMLLFFSFK